MEKLDKSDNTYDDGVVYKFDSANLEHVLQPGQRRFYFEFVDDWGIVTIPMREYMVRKFGIRQGLEKCQTGLTGHSLSQTQNPSSL